MVKLENEVLLGYSEHRYGNTYRLMARQVNRDFKVGDSLRIDMYPVGEDMLLAVFTKMDRHYTGQHKVDRQKRICFTPPRGCIDTRKGKERKPNYGKFTTETFF